MRSKFPESTIHIIVTGGQDCSLFDVYERCKEIMELNESMRV